MSKLTNVHSGRIIGIRSRVKQTKEGEARPTQVIIYGGKKPVTILLEEDQDELDFIRGIFPTEFRCIKPTEDISSLPFNHVKWEKIKLDEVAVGVHESQILPGKIRMKATKVASEYEGLKPNDTVVMCLGFGDELAYALTRRGATLQPNATVHRVPGFLLKQYREKDGVVGSAEKAKDEDGKLLVEMFESTSELFHEIKNRDEQIIDVRIKFRQVQEAMKARIACGQRLDQRLRSEVYVSDPELYPEGKLEDFFKRQKANDIVLSALESEEASRKKELENALKDLDIYQQIFAPIEGCGPAIAGRIISAIQDIRRFRSAPALKAYAGVHVMKGGKYAEVDDKKQFPRRRTGQVCNWNDEIRKALYLLTDQANRRPESFWGKKLRQNKERWAALHPDASTMHVHKTALWRTASQMIVYIYNECTKMETSKALSATNSAS